MSMSNVHVGPDGHRCHHPAPALHFFTTLNQPLSHVSCIYKSVCLFTSRVALSTWPEAWESHERMGSPGQAFLISCGESPKPGKQTFAHFFTISTWGKRQLTWGKRQLPSPCWDCINFFLPAYCEKQPGIRYWYSSIQSKLKCRGVAIDYSASRLVDFAANLWSLRSSQRPLESPYLVLGDPADPCPSEIGDRLCAVLVRLAKTISLWWTQ